MRTLGPALRRRRAQRHVNGRGVIVGDLYGTGPAGG
jgi:hypothetical protein